MTRTPPERFPSQPPPQPSQPPQPLIPEFSAQFKTIKEEYLQLPPPEKYRELLQMIQTNPNLNQAEKSRLLHYFQSFHQTMCECHFLQSHTYQMQDDYPFRYVLYMMLGSLEMERQTETREDSEVKTDDDTGYQIGSEYGVSLFAFIRYVIEPVIERLVEEYAVEWGYTYPLKKLESHPLHSEVEPGSHNFNALVAEVMKNTPECPKVEFYRRRTKIAPELTEKTKALLNEAYDKIHKQFCEEYVKYITPYTQPTTRLFENSQEYVIGMFVYIRLKTQSMDEQKFIDEKLIKQVQNIVRYYLEVWSFVTEEQQVGEDPSQVYTQLTHFDNEGLPPQRYTAEIAFKPELAHAYVKFLEKLKRDSQPHLQLRGITQPEAPSVVEMRKKKKKKGIKLPAPESGGGGGGAAAAVAPSAVETMVEMRKKKKKKKKAMKLPAPEDSDPLSSAIIIDPMLDMSRRKKKKKKGSKLSPEEDGIYYEGYLVPIGYLEIEDEKVRRKHKKKSTN